MFSKIYQKFQSREGLTLAGSFALIVFALVLIFGSAFHGPRGAYGQGGDLPSTITVTGNGQAFAVPDIARFTFTVSKDAKTMNEAQKAVSTQGNDLVQKLKDAGIEAKDIKTEGFNAYPKYETVASTVSMRPCSPDYCPPSYGSNQVIVGYTVSTTYSVKVRDLDKAGDIAQMMTAANVSSITGPDFTFDDPKVASNEARAKAIDDAKAQAKVLARQLGVSLGKIVDFQVGGGNVYPTMYSLGKTANADMAGAPAPTIEPGQTDVNVTVNITYKIR